jgi:hypothetical protein
MTIQDSLTAKTSMTSVNELSSNGILSGASQTAGLRYRGQTLLASSQLPGSSEINPMIVSAVSSSSRCAIKLREDSKTTTVHKSVSFSITKTLPKRLQTASKNAKNRPYMADFPEYIEK